MGIVILVARQAEAFKPSARHPLRLALLGGRKADGADLGDPGDHMRHFRPEMLLDLLDARQGVFDDVVQQTGGNRHRVEPHVGQDARHLEGVDQIGLP